MKIASKHKQILTCQKLFWICSLDDVIGKSYKYRIMFLKNSQ
jgi:hypothetical protein